MRNALLTPIVVLLLVSLGLPSGSAGHGDPVLVYLEEEGRFAAGLVVLGLGAAADDTRVNLASFTFTAHPCHPRLRIDLDFDPDRTEVEAGDAAYAAVRYEYQVELFDATTGDRLPNSTRRFVTPNYSMYTLPDDVARHGDVRVDLYMLKGFASQWTLRVAGWESVDAGLNGSGVCIG